MPERLQLILWTSVILLTIFGVAIGRYPWLRMNRATISLVGATLLVVMGALSFEEALQSIDWHTIVLLFGMMILNTNLRLAGFFDLATAYTVNLSRGPRGLLACIILSSGILSAVFLNDTIALVMSPLVLDITRALRRNPIPYLVGLVAAANIGSVATITGNPQNMLIGIASGISYTRFLLNLFPVAFVGMGIAWLVIVVVYRGEFRLPLERPLLPPVPPRLHRPLLYKSLFASGLLVAALVAGMSIPLAAMSAAAILLVTRRLKPERVFRELDWSLLVFFAGLFVVTGAIEVAGPGQLFFALAQPFAEGGVAHLAGAAALLSNLVSNVPAVLLFRPIIPELPNPEQAWLTLAMASTFAGNLTLLGSVANLIVAESARQRGVYLQFGEYLKAGVPITLFSLLAGIWWLM